MTAAPDGTETRKRMRIDEGRLCGAAGDERGDGRADTPAGGCQRWLHTTDREGELKMPQPRRQRFDRAIIGRSRRRGSRAEEALIGMSLAGVLVRRVEEITEAPWGRRVPPDPVFTLNKKLRAKIEQWRRHSHY